MLQTKNKTLALRNETNKVMVVDDQQCQENSEMSDKDIATQHRRKIEISKRRKLIKITGEED